MQHSTCVLLFWQQMEAEAGAGSGSQVGQHEIYGTDVRHLYQSESAEMDIENDVGAMTDDGATDKVNGVIFRMHIAHLDSYFAKIERQR
jgi:hypothetical protein